MLYRFSFPASHLKILPFVFHSFHELLEPLLAADIFEERVVFIEERIIKIASINRMF